MDPDACWEALVRKATEVVTLLDSETEPNQEEVTLLANDMADLLLAINHWAKRGGFPPAVFRRPASTL